MKLVILGDLHIRSSNPENRIDNYKEAMFNKIKYIYECGDVLLKEREFVSLQPGDFFDNPVQSNAMLTDCFSLFEHANLHSIYGQHDLKFRNKGNTALDVLIAGGIVKNSEQTTLSESVFLYSCSYNETIPEIKTKGFNILMIHKMIVEEKLWEGQVEYEWANTILRRTKFDLIVSGDNHQSFFVEHKGRHLINCGSLMRTTKAQINHKPCYVVYNTDTMKYSIKYIPVQPAEEVFDMQKIELEKERDEKLIAFVDGLIEGEEMDLLFERNIDAIKNKISKEVMTIIDDARRE